MAIKIQPTRTERHFDESEIIVSKTDERGRVTYANDVFLKVAQYHENEVLGQPHSIVRHPDMPRAVFKFLWDTIQTGEEVFAYVKNMAKSGDYYWVFAHVTATYDSSGKIIGYHSMRRLPDRAALAKIEPIYAALLAEEAKHANDRDGLAASFGMLVDLLKSNGVTYDQFVFSL